MEHRISRIPYYTCPLSPVVICKYVFINIYLCVCIRMYITHLAHTPIPCMYTYNYMHVYIFDIRTYILPLCRARAIGFKTHRTPGLSRTLAISDIVSGPCLWAPTRYRENIMNVEATMRVCVYIYVCVYVGQKSIQLFLNIHVSTRTYIYIHAIYIYIYTYLCV